MIKYVNDPIGQEVWDALSPKQRWDCIVALRGPDCYSSDGVKYVTSSVIRGRLRQIMRVGGMVNSDLRVVLIPTHRGAFMWNADHFFQHIVEAAEILNIERLWIAEDRYLHYASTFAYTFAPALRRLYEELTTGPRQRGNATALRLVEEFLADRGLGVTTPCETGAAAEEPPLAFKLKNAQWPPPPPMATPIGGEQ